MRVAGEERSTLSRSTNAARCSVNCPFMAASFARTTVQAFRCFPPTFDRTAICACVDAGLLHFSPSQLAPYLTPPTSFLALLLAFPGLQLRFLTLLVQ